jgi:hypothetical protein
LQNTRKMRSPWVGREANASTVQQRIVLDTGSRAPEGLHWPQARKPVAQAARVGRTNVEHECACLSGKARHHGRHFPAVFALSRRVVDSRRNGIVADVLGPALRPAGRKKTRFGRSEREPELRQEQVFFRFRARA